MAEVLTTGDQRLDKLITDYSNATYACGEWTDCGDEPAEEPYEAVFLKAEKARSELYSYLRERLQPTVPGDSNG